MTFFAEILNFFGSLKIVLREIVLLFLIIAVSIALVVKGELASETVNYDAKTMYRFELQVRLIKKDIPGKTGSRSSRS